MSIYLPFLGTNRRAKKEPRRFASLMLTKAIKQIVPTRWLKSTLPVLFCAHKLHIFIYFRLGVVFLIFWFYHSNLLFSPFMPVALQKYIYTKTRKGEKKKNSEKRTKYILTLNNWHRNLISICIASYFCVFRFTCSFDRHIFSNALVIAYIYAKTIHTQQNLSTIFGSANFLR